MASALKIQELISQGDLTPHEGAVLLQIKKRQEESLLAAQSSKQPKAVRILTFVPVLLFMILWSACGGSD